MKRRFAGKALSIKITVFVMVLVSCHSSRKWIGIEGYTFRTVINWSLILMKTYRPTDLAGSLI